MKSILLISLIFIFNFAFAQYEQFANSYGILSTIAGKGASDNRGTIEWLNEYEGGPATEAELARPHFAMSDTNGNIYIADKENHAIKKVDSDGIITTFAGTNQAGDGSDDAATTCALNNPNGLWVNPNGTLYILDLGNNKIKRVNSNGLMETLVHDKNGISLGRGIWVSKDEDSIFYASSSKIKLWTEATGIIDYIDGFSGIGNITQDMNGDLIVTARNENRVYRVSKNGQDKEIIAGNGNTSGGGDGLSALESAIWGVRGVWFLPDNTYFLATHEGSQIWYVDYKGVMHLFIDGDDDDDCHFGDGEAYNVPGKKISEPRSISIDNTGNIFICENDLGYIRKIESKYTYYYTSLFKNKNKAEMEVYPNPANSYLNICLPVSTPENYIISVLTPEGKYIKSSHSTVYPSIPFSLNVKDIIDGIYFVKVWSSNYSSITKIIICK